MNKTEPVEIVMDRGRSVIEFDATEIAAIIIATCEVDYDLAVTCANRVLEYLIETFTDAKDDAGLQ
jgi:hypothetical protein